LGHATSDRERPYGSRPGCRRRDRLLGGKSKGRIRWLDENEKRRSAVFDDYKRAQTELSRRQVEVEEIKRGVRNAAAPEKTFDDLCDYWIEKRAPRKRSRKDDESIIRRHLRPAFGAMKLRHVAVEEVDGYIGEKIDDEELSDKTVNNHVTLLATILRTATTFKVPWLLAVPKFREADARRNRGAYDAAPGHRGPHTRPRPLARDASGERKLC
jgi:hypothetical protein